MEGRIVQKLECRPYADNTYYKLKSESIRKASMPQRQVQQLDRIVQNFKPVSDHKHNVSIYVLSCFEVGNNCKFMIFFLTFQFVTD